MKRIANLTNKLIADLRSMRSRKPRALLVEDDDGVAAVMDRVLCDMGCTVTRDCTGGSTDAESLVGPDAPDIVFLDLMLPARDGVEVLAEIRKVRRDLPVVIVTGYPESAQLVRAATLGYVGLVAKPLRMADVQEVLQKHHIRRRLEGDRSQGTGPSEQQG